MYIQPNSTIRLIKHCPLENTYEHTLWWANQTAQTTYFTQTLAGYTFTAQSYQRSNRGYLRVNRSIEYLYDCNYLAFKNSSYEDKWFYAFVTSVEYINNAVTEIKYEIDVMQTWFFDFTLEQCFVERETPANDNPGDNLLPEDFELGEYVYTDLGAEAYLNTNLKIIMASAVDLSLNNATGGTYGGVYSGIKYLAFDGPQQANAFLADLVSPATGDKSDAIVSMFMFPQAFISNIAPEDPQAPISIDVTWTAKLDSIGTYTPKNKKLLTSPYNTFIVTTSEGNYAEYPYEYFLANNNNYIQFKLYGVLASNPEFWLVPKNYKNVASNYLEKLTFSSLPQCAYNIDTFRAWVAQHKYPLMAGYWGGFANFAIGATKMAAGIAAGNEGNFIQANQGLDSGGKQMKAGLVAAAGVVTAVKQASLMPAHAYGQPSNVLATSWGELGFHYYRAQIREEFARIIDDFFDRFGYACRRNKVPAMRNRQYWTYTKTLNCTITGSVPTDDMNVICGIFDNGITFWTDPANVGVYNRTNGFLT